MVQTPSADRALPPSLTLGLALLCILNGKRDRLDSADASWTRTLIKATSVWWAGPDAEPADLQHSFASNRQTSLIDQRGMYFLAEYCEAEGRSKGKDEHGRNTVSCYISPQVHPKSALEEPTLAAAHGLGDFSLISATFGQLSVHQIPAPQRKRLTFRSKGKTLPYHECWAQVPPECTFHLPPEIQFDYHRPGVDQLTRGDSDSDLDETDLEGIFDNPEKVLELIMFQFLHDLIEKCPALQNGKPHLTLSQAEKDHVRVELFQDVELPFHRVHIRFGKNAKWRTNIQNMFPVPAVGDTTIKISKTSYNYRYFVLWARVINGLDNPGHRKLVYNAMEDRLNSFEWLPYVSSPPYWHCGRKNSQQILTYPAEQEGDIAPHIIAHPRHLGPCSKTQWRLSDTRV